MNTSEQIVQDMRRVAAFVKNDAIIQNEYERYGNYGYTTVRYHFGTWDRAKAAAGLPLNRHNGNRKHIDDEVQLLEIIHLTRRLNKEPTESELSAFGKYRPRPYRSRW